jgi:phosphatidylglycerophosphate synthase
LDPVAAFVAFRLLFALLVPPVPSAAHRFRTASAVERWSLINAAALTAATGAALVLRATWPLLAVGAGMLAGLAVLARFRWTPDGRFGPANLLTAGRLAALCSLPLLVESEGGSPGVVLMGLAVLGADGLDGWLARRYGLASEFGEFFDKETDAFFLLLLCALAAFEQALPAWIVGAGLLRYVFVLALFAVQTEASNEARSSAARYTYVTMIAALLAAFLPYPSIYRPLVAAATLALLASFAPYFWWLIRLRRAND